MSSRFLTNRRAFCFVQAPSPRDIFPAQLDFAGSARWFRHRGIGRAKKVSGSCFFHEPLTRNAEVDPAGPLRLRGGRIIWVSLRWDALLRPCFHSPCSQRLGSPWPWTQQPYSLQFYSLRLCFRSFSSRPLGSPPKPRAPPLRPCRKIRPAWPLPRQPDAGLSEGAAGAYIFKLNLLQQ
jgi:hypothetical protein